MLLTPGGEVGRDLLDGDEARILAELRVDDPLLDDGIGLLEALVQRLIGLREAALEIFLLIELLLGGGLGDREFLDLRQ